MACCTVVFGAYGYFHVSLYWASSDDSVVERTYAAKCRLSTGCCLGVPCYCSVLSSTVVDIFDQGFLFAKSFELAIHLILEHRRAQHAYVVPSSSRYGLELLDLYI